MATQQIPSYSHPIVDPRTGRITTPWYQFLMRLTSAANSGGGGGSAPGDAQYIVGAVDADLPNARVPTDSPSIDFDLGTAAQLKATVIPGGVDGQFQFNDAGVLGGQWMPQFGTWQPVTAGDPSAPDLVFNSEGDVVMVWVPA